MDHSSSLSARVAATSVPLTIRGANSVGWVCALVTEHGRCKELDNSYASLPTENAGDPGQKWWISDGFRILTVCVITQIFFR